MENKIFFAEFESVTGRKDRISIPRAELVEAISYVKQLGRLTPGSYVIFCQEDNVVAPVYEAAFEPPQSDARNLWRRIVPGYAR